SILAFGSLAYEHSFLCKTAHEPWVHEAVRRLMQEFREAHKRLGSKFSGAWRDWMASTDCAIKNTGCVALLQGESHLEHDVLVRSYFRSIGDLLEGSLQPFARLRLNANNVVRGQTFVGPSEFLLSFGDVIEKLSTRDKIYRPAPWFIAVSQWRNI